ncbi:hypothetical protein JCM11251_004519 [Rhodosporidiobolus azoricus]
MAKLRKKSLTKRRSSVPLPPLTPSVSSLTLSDPRPSSSSYIAPIPVAPLDASVPSRYSYYGVQEDDYAYSPYSPSHRSYSHSPTTPSSVSASYPVEPAMHNQQPPQEGHGAPAPQQYRQQGSYTPPQHLQQPHAQAGPPPLARPGSGLSAQHSQQPASYGGGQDPRARNGSYASNYGAAGPPSPVGRGASPGGRPFPPQSGPSAQSLPPSQARHSPAPSLSAHSHRGGDGSSSGGGAAGGSGTRSTSVLPSQGSSRSLASQAQGQQGQGGPPTIGGEPLHDLNGRAIALLKSSKFYAEGFLMKRVEAGPDGKPPSGNDGQWAKWFVQLSGTIMSTWNAAEMEEAARNNTTVPPQYLNLQDAFLHPFPPHARGPKTPTQFQFALNSAGQNRILFCAPTLQSLTMWINAIRLSVWERSRCNEIYTGSLLGLREPRPFGWQGFDAGLPGAGKPGRFEGWIKARLPGDTEWRRVWTVLLRGSNVPSRMSLHGQQAVPAATAVVSEKEEKRNRRSSLLSFGKKKGDKHKDEDTPIAAIDNLPGDGLVSTLAFWSTKPSGKRAEPPLCIAQHVFYASALFPEAEALIESSTLFKVEGTFLNPADGYKSGWGVGGRAEKQGYALLMLEEGGMTEMLHWIVALADVFKLYGRPRNFSFDPRDPNSPYFALPIGPHRDRQFLDRELVDNLDINESRPRAIRATFHNILFDRIRGIRPNPPQAVPPTEARASPSRQNSTPTSPVDGTDQPRRWSQLPQAQQRDDTPKLPPVLDSIGEGSPVDEGDPTAVSTDVPSPKASAMPIEPQGANARRLSIHRQATADRRNSQYGAPPPAQAPVTAPGQSTENYLGDVGLRRASQGGSTAENEFASTYTAFLSSDIARERTPPPPVPMQPTRSHQQRLYGESPRLDPINTTSSTTPTATQPLSAQPSSSHDAPSPVSGEMLETPQSQAGRSDLAHLTWAGAHPQAVFDDHHLSQLSHQQSPVYAKSNNEGPLPSPGASTTLSPSAESSRMPPSPGLPYLDNSPPRAVAQNGFANGAEAVASPVAQYQQQPYQAFSSPRQQQQPERHPQQEAFSSPSSRATPTFASSPVVAPVPIVVPAPAPAPARSPSPPVSAPTPVAAAQPGRSASPIEAAPAPATAPQAARLAVRNKTSNRSLGTSVSQMHDGKVVDSPEEEPLPSPKDDAPGGNGAYSTQPLFGGMGSPRVTQEAQQTPVGPQPIEQQVQEPEREKRLAEEAPKGEQERAIPSSKKAEGGKNGFDVPEDYNIHQDLLAALDFVDHGGDPDIEPATPVSPSSLGHQTPNMGGRPFHVGPPKKGMFEPPSPSDEHYGFQDDKPAAPEVEVLAQPAPSKPASGNVSAGSSARNSASSTPAPTAFPSSFANNKRDERAAAAQLAQQAKEAALTQPGRAAGVPKKKKVWQDSDEEEEEEEEEEESSDEELPPRRVHPSTSSHSLAPSPANNSRGTSPIPPSSSMELPPPVPHQLPQQRFGRSPQRSPGVDPAARQSYLENGPGFQNYGPAGSAPPASPSREAYQVSPQPQTAPTEGQPFRKPALNPHGLLATGMLEKEERSARAQEHAARDVGSTLISLTAKPPPPQTGLVGALTSHEREKATKGGVGKALTEQQREKKLAEQRQKQLDDMQRQQLAMFQQQQQMQMSQFGGGGMGGFGTLGMNSMPSMGFGGMNPYMMGGMMPSMSGYGGFPGGGSQLGMPASPLQPQGTGNGGDAAQAQAQAQAQAVAMQQQQQMMAAQAAAQAAAQQAYLAAMQQFSPPASSPPAGSPSLPPTSFPPSMSAYPSMSSMPSMPTMPFMAPGQGGFGGFPGGSPQMTGAPSIFGHGQQPSMSMYAGSQFGGGGMGQFPQFGGQQPGQMPMVNTTTENSDSEGARAMSPLDLQAGRNAAGAGRRNGTE